MQLSEFQPQPTLVVPETQIDHPRFPVFDAHNHLGAAFGGGWDARPVAALLDVLDAAGVTRLVDLDGGWGEDILDAHLAHFKEVAPERFLVFGGVDWAAWPEHGDAFGEWAAGRLRAQAARGAEGLKILEAVRPHRARPARRARRGRRPAARPGLGDCRRPPLAGRHPRRRSGRLLRSL